MIDIEIEIEIETGTETETVTKIEIGTETKTENETENVTDHAIVIGIETMAAIVRNIVTGNDLALIAQLLQPTVKTQNIIHSARNATMETMQITTGGLQRQLLSPGVHQTSTRKVCPGRQIVLYQRKIHIPSNEKPVIKNAC